MSFSATILQEKWDNGIPMTANEIREHHGDFDIDGEKVDGILVEEGKSVKRAMIRGHGVGVSEDEITGQLCFFRLCDWCNRPRGEMWIVNPEVWEARLHRDNHRDDICLDCWNGIEE
jgi:hypothetical protein